MINSQSLLADLKQQLKVLQADLRESAEDPDSSWGQRLKQQHQRALETGRTGHAWVTWRDGEVDQAAVAWLVATTFIRFCEDNGLLDGARDANGGAVPTLWLAGPGERTARAVEYENEYFRAQPSANRRDWMQQAFSILAAQPAGRALVDPQHSLVWTAPISADAADGLAAFWRRTTADGEIVHDFTDPTLDTRFLGDLYQDLSEYAKKTYALLQTPEFVEEFILDLTLKPAIEEFGLPGLKLIDPTCGSGHFLLGAFERLNKLWAEQEPGVDVRARVQRAMESIHGVDLNPFAVAIARFRLTVAGLQAAGLRSLVEAPAFNFHLAVGDSLLGEQGTQAKLNLSDDDAEKTFEYDAEDLSEYQGILTPGQYHVVVGNPPYITVKDKAANDAYRRAYKTTHRQYALSVPFAELFFRLAIKGNAGEPAGHVGQITANSFMKREFGKKLIEDFFAGRDAELAFENPADLTHVIDTSGAYIPGHGTPTVILVGRRRRPVEDTVRAVLGVRGEPGQPENPARGLVWSEIVNLGDGEHDGTYVTVTDVDRALLTVHPWSLSGGGAADLALKLSTGLTVGQWGAVVGRTTHTGLDEAFYRPIGFERRHAISEHVPVILGDEVRDFVLSSDTVTLFPYDGAGNPAQPGERFASEVWSLRTVLARRMDFGQTPHERGLRWFDHSMFFAERFRRPLGITFAFVATHNHFVLDRGGKVFKQTAPVIKLPEGASEEQHLELLGVLNSSTACFWLKQVSHDRGRDQVEPWGWRYEFTGTKLQEFPLPGTLPLERGRRLDTLAQQLQAVSPTAVVQQAATDPDVAEGNVTLREHLEADRARWHGVRSTMIHEQEELDWETYRLYGLVDEDLTYTPSESEPIALALGERAFEIALARKMAQGEEETAWFERHGSTPITELPHRWPDDYRQLVQRRLDLIDSSKSIRLLEKPEYKRRWSTPGWDVLLRDALTDAILDRLESRDLWFDGSGQPTPKSVGEVADIVRTDPFLVQCAQVLAGTDEIDLAKVLTDLLKNEPVPYLAALRYKEPGIEKYREWQRVWDLQRREDNGEKVTIPVPPKYKPADFRKTSYWSHRGKLDVPKERFIAYPGVVRPGDATQVIGWAGWNHAEQAQALAGEYQRQLGLGAEPEQLKPLLAGLDELQPWLDQWHGEVDHRFGQSPAQMIRTATDAFAASLNVTRTELNAWRPPAATRGRRPKA